MDHRGHPQKPIERESLPLAQIAGQFIEDTHEEDPVLGKSLGGIDEGHRNLLAGILVRFDTRKQGRLDAHQRLLARRVINRLHRLTVESLTLTNKILDYLDLNTNAIIEENELDLCVQVLELFSRAESDNETLSERELQMLYAVLRHLDANDNRKLDAHEREQLVRDFSEPEAFLQDQKVSNPLLRAFLDRS